MKANLLILTVLSISLLGAAPNARAEMSPGDERACVDGAVLGVGVGLASTAVSIKSKFNPINAGHWIAAGAAGCGAEYVAKQAISAAAAEEAPSAQDLSNAPSEDQE